jgi:hypothetical protein
MRRPPSNLAGLGLLGLVANRLISRPLREAQSSPGTPVPAPSRLGLADVPINDVQGSNLDTHGKKWSGAALYWTKTSEYGRYPTEKEIQDWEAYKAKYTQYADYVIDYMVKRTGYNTYPTFAFDSHPGYSPLQPSVLGIYSRGDTLIKTAYPNHMGMWAFYGGDPRSRIYVDPAQQKNNRAMLGSVVSPRTALSHYRVATSTGSILLDNGFRWGKFATYDWGFLTSPPPFWIAPSTTSVAGTSVLTVSFGSIYEAAVP